MDANEARKLSAAAKPAREAETLAPFLSRIEAAARAGHSGVVFDMIPHEAQMLLEARGFKVVGSGDMREYSYTVSW